MSSQNNNKLMCSSHENFEIIAVDLKKQTIDKQGNKFLCAQCLIQKLGDGNIILYNQTIEMIKDLKQKSNQLNREACQLKLQNMQELESSINNFNELFNDIFNKLLKSIDQQIKENQKEIQSKDVTIDLINLAEDVQILSDNYQGDNQYSIPREQINVQSISQFLDVIKLPLIQLSSSSQFSQILQSIKKIEQQYSIIQQHQNNEKEQKKTPSLNQICTDHQLEIIAINLHSIGQESETNRFACIECIEQNPIKYISLKKVNQKWNEFIEEQNQLTTQYNSKRESKLNSFIKLIEQLKDNYIKTLSQIEDQIIQLLQIDNSKEQYQIKNISFFEQDEQSIKQIVDILSQKDKHATLQAKQDKINEEDSLLFLNLKQGLDNLIKQDLFAKEQLVKISNSNFDDSFIFKINEQNTKNDCQECQDFIIKTQISDQYLSIINESIQFHLKLQTEVDNLVQKGTLQLTNTDQQSQNEIQQLTQKQYQKFIQNSKQMTLIQMAQENDKQVSNLQKQLLEVNTKHNQLQQTDKDSKIKIQTLEKQIADSNSKYQKELKEKQEQFSIKEQELQNKLNKTYYKWTFSDTYKHANCRLSQCKTIVDESAQGDYYYCLADQMLPKNQTTFFAFRIFAIGSWCFVGIGEREVLKSKGFKGWGQGGDYTILQDGRNFSHHQINIRGNNYNSIKFANNDTILIEVNMQSKYIKWTKLQSNEQFSLEIDPNLDLYPCVNLFNGTKIQIF
ncbi:unnamed protein product [Paramecium sonneborni]|uniref:Uncharacterized protein n=1 Tax=Paramecium sonneborni TaxID=65129 RepID=A0A8S1MFB2_9CILI|nr:unnamed protein product [Paramecium sonneborni]